MREWKINENLLNNLVTILIEMKREKRLKKTVYCIILIAKYWFFQMPEDDLASHSLFNPLFYLTRLLIRSFQSNDETEVLMKSILNQSQRRQSDHLHLIAMNRLFDPSFDIFTQIMQMDAIEY